MDRATGTGRFASERPGSACGRYFVRTVVSSERRPGRRALLRIFVPLVLIGAVAGAAPALARSEPSQGEAAAGLIPHVDPTFGFELRVPAGWAYDRGRFVGPQGSIGVLRGHGPGGLQALQILVFRSFDLPDFSAWLHAFVEHLGEAYGGRQVPQRRWDQETGERAVLLVDTPVAGRRTQTYYLCIPFDANTVWVLVLASAVSTPEDEARLRALFDSIGDSVHVLYDPVEAQKIAAAFNRGLELLARLRREAAELPIDETERFYDIRLGGKSIGYLSRWLRRERRAIDDPRFARVREPGLRVHEESWRFAEDGTIRQTELNLFSTFDLRSELIENRTTQIPAPDVMNQRLYIELDECFRKDDVLVSSFTTNIEPDLPPPRPPIPIGPRYLDLAWVRVLPRLLLGAPHELHAFAVYDCQARALGIYMIRPLGPATRPAGQAGEFVFEVREGFVPRASRLYTDREGNVTRLECGDLVLTEIPAAEVERRYGARRAAARQRMEGPAFPPRKP